MKRIFPVLFLTAGGLLLAQPAAPPPPAQPAPPSTPAPPAAPAAPAPPRYARAVVALHEGSWLGVGVAEVDTDRAKELKLSEARGVEITRVVPDSPAEKAGLKDHDVVLEYNGQRVEGTEQFQRLVRETPPKRQVKLQIVRNGSPQTVTATIGEARQFETREWQQSVDQFERLQQELGSMQRNLRLREMPTPMMAWRTPALGIEAESLSSQLADFFGVKEGVLVRSVTRDSAAEKAGIKAGDVITMVDGQTVSTPSQISSRIRGSSSKKTFPVTVVRNRKETTLNVTLEDQAPQEVGPRRVRTPRTQPLRGRFVSVSPGWL